MNTKDFDFLSLTFRLCSDLRELARYYKALGNRDVYDAIHKCLDSFYKGAEDLLQ